MRNFEWTAEHAVRVPEFDGEHQDLFRCCGDLERAVRDGAPAGAVQAILQRLATHTVKHFAHEERRMRATGYAYYAWHRRQHVAARSKVALLAQRIQAGDADAAGELLDYLSGWLHDHVRLADRLLGAYLRNYARECEVREAHEAHAS